MNRRSYRWRVDTLEMSSGSIPIAPYYPWLGLTRYRLWGATIELFGHTLTISWRDALTQLRTPVRAWIRRGGGISCEASGRAPIYWLFGPPSSEYLAVKTCSHHLCRPKDRRVCPNRNRV